MRLAFLLILLVLSLLIAGAARSDTTEVLTFTRAQLDALEAELEGMVLQREAAAFEWGRADARQRCASLVGFKR